MDLRWRRRLEVDLRPGVDADEWDELLDAIIQELPNADRVQFTVPALTDSQERLLEAMIHVLEGRGVTVERRNKG
jgi:hypothetical protein